jgi:hypothetical protein
MRQRFIISVVICLLCFSGCKKENESEDIMKGKIDGIAFEYKNNLSANTPEASGTGVADPTLRIKGYELGHGKIELYILSETTSIHTGVYPFTIDKQRSGVFTTGGIAYYAGPPGIFSPGGMLGLGNNYNNRSK